MRDPGQFFGFRQVAQGYLGRFTQFISIPAVRNAQTDATEGKGSSVTQIMDLVVRNVLVKPTVMLLSFGRNTQEQYSSIMEPPPTSAELNDLADKFVAKRFSPMSRTLVLYLELVSIAGDKSTSPCHKHEVKLLEDEYEARVERTGHGLQRAFIVTMLQHLVAAQKQDSAVKLRRRTSSRRERRR